MSNCDNSTLLISRPSQNGFTGQCQTCNSLGPTDPLDLSSLGSRPKRAKVKAQIRDYILHMLGGTGVRIELNEQDIDFCVDQALMIFENYAPREFFNYYTFNTIPGKSVYTMPPEIGFIRNVFYRKQPSFSFQSSDLQGAIPVEYFYPGGSYASIQGGLIDPVQPIWGRMGEWVLYKNYEQMYSRISSSIGGWEWVDGYSNIKLYPIPHSVQLVIVHYLQKNKDWAQVSQAMQEGALTYAKEILGRIRGKIKNIPGPGGGVQLDGDQLMQEAREDRKQWFEDLIYKFGDIPPITLD